jgi:SAM-dependent methyltransferase
LKPSLMQYLVCINCKGELHLQENHSVPTETAEGREIMAGVLLCKQCLKQYQITQGVPRFVDSQLSTGTDIKTGSKFGVAWREFSRIDESYRGQFFDWIDPVDPDFIKDKLVLEAGCGKGRHAQVVKEAGARVVFGIDIGDAVDVAYQNVGHMEGVHLIQSDIRRPPFGKVFDFVFSVGVLHHMKDPQSGFSALVDCLAPNGSICVWVYGEENNWWIIHLVSPIRTAITTKLPAPILRVISFLLAVPVFISAKLIALPYADLRKRAKVLPELFYETYLAYIARFDFTEIEHIVFDHLIAPVAYYIPRGEIESWFAKSGFKKPTIRWHNKNSWTGFALNQERVFSNFPSVGEKI